MSTDAQNKASMKRADPCVPALRHADIPLAQNDNYSMPVSYCRDY